MRHNFAVFILTHGRPEKVYTYRTLLDCGYKDKIYLVVDDEDETIEKYREIYGAKVIQFSKLDVAKKIDTADLSNDRRSIVYARNACFDIAQGLGVDYFLQLDDDYTSFYYCYPFEGKLKNKKIKNMGDICDAFIDFLEESGALTVAFAQGGDMIGGLKAKTGGAYQKKILRKAMNSFFCKTSNRFEFSGRINEDVNTYTSLSNKGKLFFTVTDIKLIQKQTQSNSGGMTEMYLDNGTYLKSFYSVIFSPQAVTVQRMDGNTHRRIHHQVDWNKCAPLILSDKWKKV